MLPHRSLNIPDHCWTVEGSNITHLNIFYPDKIFISWLHYLITFYIFNVVHFVCNVTFIGCFMIIRVHNQTEYRLVIDVNNTLCPGKHRKKETRKMAHTSPHIVCTMSWSGCKIVVPEQIQLPTHYLEFHEKSKCLTSYFYLIIGMVRRVPKKGYIIYCVYNEPKLQITTSKSGHISNAEKLQIAVWYLELPHLAHGLNLERDAELCQCRCLQCGFKSRLVQDFQRNILFFPSQYWDIISLLCLRARYFTLTCFIWLRCKSVSGRTEMAMCATSS